MPIEVLNIDIDTYQSVLGPEARILFEKLLNTPGNWNWDKEIMKFYFFKQWDLTTETYFFFRELRAIEIASDSLKMEKVYAYFNNVDFSSVPELQAYVMNFNVKVSKHLEMVISYDSQSIEPNYNISFNKIKNQSISDLYQMKENISQKAGFEYTGRPYKNSIQEIICQDTKEYIDWNSKGNNYKYIPTKGDRDYVLIRLGLEKSLDIVEAVDSTTSRGDLVTHRLLK